jgi:hypothetical protein
MDQVRIALPAVPEAGPVQEARAAADSVQAAWPRVVWARVASVVAALPRAQAVGREALPQAAGTAVSTLWAKVAATLEAPMQAWLARAAGTRLLGPASASTEPWVALAEVAGLLSTAASLARMGVVARHRE